MAKNGPFATFLIIGPTCFFLGILFASFPYDYYVLWASPPTTTSTAPTPNYYNILESHLQFLHASPPLISRILHIVIGTGLSGLMLKLYKPTEANMLFDGATLVLYMCGITVYIANIVKGLRIVSAGVYGEIDAETGIPYGGGDVAGSEKLEEGAGVVVGKEDSLKVFAASNTILAVILVGVLVLQAGQWYAQRKEDAEIAEMDRVREGKKATAAVGGAGGPAGGAPGAGAAVKGKGKVAVGGGSAAAPTSEEGKKKV